MHTWRRTIKAIKQNGFTLSQHESFPSRSSRLYSFKCDNTGNGYDFGACHTECVDAFVTNSLTEMIKNYPQLAIKEK